MSQRSKFVFAAVFLLLLFVGGAGVGIAVDRLWLLRSGFGRPPGPMLHGPSEMVTRAFTVSLNLDPAQAAVVREAIEDAHRKLLALRALDIPQREQITREARTRISAVLDDAQRAEFDRMDRARGPFPPPGFRGGPDFRGPPFPPFGFRTRTSTRPP